MSCIFEKNVCESIIGTLLNIPGKTKDKVKTWMDFELLDLRKDLHPKVEPSRTYLQLACYTMSKEEKKVFCKYLFEL